ncbi:uncharacterized protein LOC111829313 [Capsella rubella]|uniref:uncharacterized protein LOC111829313 n=1 Tax=Capsella rubella TaxID=81985 RepID=UPI000CD52BDD|nr:uncharacterized protein LOC111829313 [Capsella rubella]
MNPMENEGQVQGGAPNVLGVLNPTRMNGTLWFKHDSVITSEIRTIIRSDFNGPYRNYSTTPITVKERWFNTFRKEKTEAASYIDVLRETHKKPDGSFVDERAKQISEGYEQKIADLENEIVAMEEIVEATNGRVFGLGALFSELSIKGGVSAIFENNVENEEALKQKLEEIYEENEQIKERINKLEGLEKMIHILIPHLSTARANN